MIRWLKDPTPAGMLVFLTVLVILAAAVILFTLPTEAHETASQTPEPSPTPVTLPADMDGEHGPISEASEVEAMILHIVDNLYKCRWNPANRNEKYRKRIAAAAAVETDRHGIPDGLVPAIMYRESSFDHRKVDGVGATGLMQVSPCMMDHLDCDMSTPEGQVDCGCRALVYYYELCGTDWRAALAAYGSHDANCDPERGGHLRWMVDDRFALAKKLREVTDQ